VAHPSRRFAVFMPPWSIVRAAASTCVVSTAALAASGPAFLGAPKHAVAWDWRGGELPSTIQAVAEAVLQRGQCVDVSREFAPSDTARRAKILIDESYCRPVTLARVAAEAALSPSALSRCFKRAYGMAPVEYRHRLRVMDAMFRLAAGGEILEVLQDVGFGDTSRFYSHFRSLLCAPPGSYAVRSRNAKT
jgi:AraC-like DNA-binding protein